jgi:diguanylate cyclase (GGDEF)-like protein
MSIASAPTSTFEQLTAQAGDELASTALAIAAQAGDDPRLGSLVVVVHPERDNHRVLAASGIGVLRAAVSVAVASGNARLWEDVAVGDTVEHAVRSLPEVIRAAAEASQVVATHTGTVRAGDSLEAVAIWFESEAGVASAVERRNALDFLTAAAERDVERLAEAAEQAAAATSTTSETSTGVAGPGPRQFDPADPDVDAVTGLANRERFERALENHSSDEATLVVLDIDRFAEITEEFGTEVAEQVLLEIADRVVDECRKSDFVARIDVGTFAVLFGDADRSTGLRISKRLLTRIAEHLSVAPGPEAITATVAFAHQFGLVDTDELMQSADDALRSGKRSGGGRLFLGS